MIKWIWAHKHTVPRAQLCIYLVGWIFAICSTRFVLIRFKSVFRLFQFPPLPMNLFLPKISPLPNLWERGPDYISILRPSYTKGEGLCLRPWSIKRQQRKFTVALILLAVYLYNCTSNGPNTSCSYGGLMATINFRQIITWFRWID